MQDYNNHLRFLNTEVLIECSAIPVARGVGFWLVSSLDLGRDKSLLRIAELEEGTLPSRSCTAARHFAHRRRLPCDRRRCTWHDCLAEYFGLGNQLSSKARYMQLHNLGLVAQIELSPLMRPPSIPFTLRQYCLPQARVISHIPASIRHGTSNRKVCDDGSVLSIRKLLQI